MDGSGVLPCRYTAGFQDSNQFGESKIGAEYFLRRQLSVGSDLLKLGYSVPASRGDAVQRRRRRVALRSDLASSGRHRLQGCGRAYADRKV